MKGPPPLRFLTFVLGGWVCARAAVLGPDWWTETGEASESRHRQPPPRGEQGPLPVPGTMAAAVPSTEAPPIREKPSAKESAPLKSWAGEPPAALALDFASGRITLAATTAPIPNLQQEVAEAAPEIPVQAPLSPASVLQSEPSRVAVSGWAIVRPGGEPQLATAGVLGGSQAGARLTYRMSPSLSLSGRLSSPLEDSGAEAAVGVEWQPVRSVPVKILAERRQAIGDGGRSAFAFLAHGGVSNLKVAGPVEAEAYVQAGVVGLSERDAFADGAIKLAVPVADKVSVGAGAWGAAQPGLARLDVGPHVTVSLPGGPAPLRVSAEWRLRVAGNAEPGSGPALTLATDF